VTLPRSAIRNSALSQRGGAGIAPSGVIVEPRPGSSGLATWIWRASDPERLTTSARRAIDEAERSLVSAISVWEVAMLVAKRRIQLDRPVEQWVDIALALPGIQLAPLEPGIAVRSTKLPGEFHPDPARPDHRSHRTRERGADHHAGRENPLVSPRPVRLVNGSVRRRGADVIRSAGARRRSP